LDPPPPQLLPPPQPDPPPPPQLLLPEELPQPPPGLAPAHHTAGTTSAEEPCGVYEDEAGRVRAAATSCVRSSGSGTPRRPRVATRNAGSVRWACAAPNSAAALRPARVIRDRATAAQTSPDT
ncbi:hypothetical protein ACPXCX_53075, partial [Streptomyces sp. DT225]